MRSRSCARRLLRNRSVVAPVIREGAGPAFVRLARWLADLKMGPLRGDRDDSRFEYPPARRSLDFHRTASPPGRRQNPGVLMSTLAILAGGLLWCSGDGSSEPPVVHDECELSFIYHGCDLYSEACGRNCGARMAACAQGPCASLARACVSAEHEACLESCRGTIPCAASEQRGVWLGGAGCQDQTGSCWIQEGWGECWCAEAGPGNGRNTTFHGGWDEDFAWVCVVNLARTCGGNGVP
jgi:hypothetical protein